MEFIKLLIFLTAFGRFTGAADLDYDIQRNIYVVDRSGSMLVKFSPAGDSLEVVNGFGSGSLQFDSPEGLSARQGNDIFIADYNNNRVQRFDRTLDYITSISTRNNFDDEKGFEYPRDVAVTRQGDILILDGESKRVVKLNPFGEFIGKFGDMTSGAGRLMDPSRIEVDGRDNVYLLDRERLVQFDPFGSYVRDFPLPAGMVPASISIDRDTLVVTGHGQIHLYDLATNSALGRFALGTPAVAARLIDGRIFALEERRVVVYALPAPEEEAPTEESGE